MYETSRPYKVRTIQDNLRIDLFARKHNLTIEQVEIALGFEPDERKKYLKSVTSKFTLQ